MILANSSVSGKAATGHVLKVRSHRRLSPNTRSSSKIIAPSREPLVFRNELRNLSWEVRFLLGNGVGIEVLAESIFVRGVSPFNGSAPRTGPCRPRSSSKIITPNREPLVFRNELRKRVRTSHGRFVFYWGNGEGIEVLAEPIFVRAQPFNGRHASCPLYWKLALYRLLLLAQKKLYKTFEWDSILTQFSFSRQPSNKTRHVRYRTKSKRDNRKPAQCQ